MEPARRRGADGTAGALGSAMHPMSFMHKRVHLSAVATGRKMFARIRDMTAARFDILYLINEDERWAKAPYHEELPGMPQALITRRLGLKRQTVWQVVKRLVALRLVHKHVERRRVYLSLTPEGVKRISWAYCAAFRERYPLPDDVPLGQQETRNAYRIVRDEAHFDEWMAAIFDMSPINAHIKFVELPKKVGREVAKVFTSFAWKRTPPGHARYKRHLANLRAMIKDAQTIAEALGDQSDLIYPLPKPRWERRRLNTNANANPNADAKPNANAMA